MNEVQHSVTVVIVTFNVPNDMLLACLSSLDSSFTEARVSGDIVIVDNGSSRPPVVERAGVQVVYSSENRGFAAAVNNGVVLAQGEYVLCLNPDATLSQGALSAFFRAHDGTPKRLLCGRLANKGRLQVDAFLLWRFSVARFLFRPREKRRLESATTDRVAVRKVSGGALFGRRDELLALGPFDEDFFLYGEDVDLSIRAMRCGYELFLANNALVEHYASYSSVNFGELVERARTDAALRVLSKHNRYLVSIIGRVELAIVTIVGLLLSQRTSSSSSSARLARLSELRRWALHSSVPRFSPASRTRSRLAIVSPVLQGGGAQRAAEGVVSAVRNSFLVELVVLFNRNRNEQSLVDVVDKARVFGFGRSPWGLFRCWWRLVSYRKRYDVVLSLTRGSTIMLGLPMVRMHSQKLILSQHMLPSLESSGRSRRLEDYLYRRAVGDAACVVTPSPRAAAELRVLFPRIDVECIPNPGTFWNEPVAPWNTPGDGATRLLFAGRIEPEKQVLQLVRALAARATGPVQLRIAGNGSLDHELDQTLESLRAAALTVERRGWLSRTEMMESLDWCHALVQPSSAELRPYSILEAWSRHRPVIASDIEPHRALAEEGPMFITPITSVGLTSAIEMLKTVPHGGPDFSTAASLLGSVDGAAGYLRILAL